MKVLKVSTLISASLSAVTTVSALKFLPMELLDNITGFWHDEESEFKDLRGNTLSVPVSSVFKQIDKSKKKASSKLQQKSGAAAQEDPGLPGDWEQFFPGFSGEVVRKDKVMEDEKQPAENA